MMLDISEFARVFFSPSVDCFGEVYTLGDSRALYEAFSRFWVFVVVG